MRRVKLNISSKNRTNKRKSNKTRKIRVRKVDYSKKCRNIKSDDFVRELYSKNISKRITQKFKKNYLRNKHFLNHRGNIDAIHTDMWTSDMRRQYKLIRNKYVMKDKEKDKFRNDYKCNIFRTITKNHKQLIIGVLSNPTMSSATLGATSYIPQSYVKWLEMHGARVVPIMYDIPKQMINVLLNQIDGLLLIGGTIESIIIEKDHYRYLSTLKYIVDKITHFNLIGNHFPIFSICLGFELLLMVTNESDISKISNRFVNNKSISFLRKYGSSSMRFTPVIDKDMLVTRPMQEYFTEKEKKMIEKEPSVAMIHNKSFIIGSSYMKEYEKFINITGISSHSGKNYISSYQFKSLPYYGVQFHPEKVYFEHIQEDIPHNETSKMFSTKLCKMFLKECSKNYNIHVFGVNDDANFFIENYDLLSRENAIKVLFPHKSKLYNTSMLGSSYYFGRLDSIKSDIIDLENTSKNKSIKYEVPNKIYNLIQNEKNKEKENNFSYTI